jgi:hypothetical protein
MCGRAFALTVLARNDILRTPRASSIHAKPPVDNQPAARQFLKLWL